MINIIGFEQVIKKMNYPAGEVHVELSYFPAKGQVIQVSSCKSFESICEILTANEIIVREGGYVTWYVPYFPFGRHDRRNHRLDGFELGLAMEMVGNLDIITLDPHSDVLGQMKHIPQKDVVILMDEKFDLFKKEPLIVIPDHGATKKAHTWLMGSGLDFVQGYKSRDVSTGNLTGFGVEDEKIVHARDCLIIDDICDGGGTFIGLAKELVKAGATGISLAVTHGLFTKGTKDLFDYMDNIYSTGPYVNDGVDRLGQHEVFERSNYAYKD